jgi:hypothetical protein
MTFHETLDILHDIRGTIPKVAIENEIFIWNNVNLVSFHISAKYGVYNLNEVHSHVQTYSFVIYSLFHLLFS